MKPVEFIAGQQVELPLDELLVTKMARYVEHESPVSETRSIFNSNGGDAFARMLGQLRQRLQAVEQSGSIGRRDRDAAMGNIEPITLGSP